MTQIARGKLVVIGASAGGIGVLLEIVGALPSDLDATVLIVCHMSMKGPSRLAELLQRRCALKVTTAVDGDTIQRGRIYVARPDRHLMVEDGRIRTPASPRQNYSRPAIDPLFRSAALMHGPRVVGVVLSGVLDDGASGLACIRERGGLAIVQEPSDALFPDMPRSALALTETEHVVPASGIGARIARLAETPREVDMPRRDVILEARVARDAGRFRRILPVPAGSPP